MTGRAKEVKCTLQDVTCYSTLQQVTTGRRSSLHVPPKPVERAVMGLPGGRSTWPATPSGWGSVVED